MVLGLASVGRHRIFLVFTVVGFRTFAAKPCSFIRLSESSNMVIWRLSSVGGALRFEGSLFEA